MSKRDKYTVQVTQENWKQLKKDGLLKIGRKVWVKNRNEVGRIYDVEWDDYYGSLVVGVKYYDVYRYEEYWPCFSQGIYIKPKKETIIKSDKKWEDVPSYQPLIVTLDNWKKLVKEGKLKVGTKVRVDGVDGVVVGIDPLDSGSDLPVQVTNDILRQWVDLRSQTLEINLDNEPEQQAEQQPEKVFPYWLDVTENNIGKLVNDGVVKEGSVIKAYYDGSLQNGIVKQIDAYDGCRPLYIMFVEDCHWVYTSDIRQVLIDNV